MGSNRTDSQALRYPCEWVATAGGQVVAHGFDFAQVAQEACGKASDIAFEHIPDPGAPLWRPARIAPGPVPPPKGVSTMRPANRGRRGDDAILPTEPRPAVRPSKPAHRPRHLARHPGH